MIISIHEYNLAENTTHNEFENSVAKAKSRGLFDLPGLVDYSFIKGLKGARKGEYSAIWVYENQQVWEALWGTPEDPKSKSEYPEIWIEWEDEILAPLLASDPDEIQFTTYRTLEN